MASICTTMSISAHIRLRTNPIPMHILYPPILAISSLRFLPARFFALKTGSRIGSRSGFQDDVNGAELLKKPVVEAPGDDELLKDSDEEEEDGSSRRRREKEEEWVDWEDQILEDTVPLVGFVRMVLHSGKYESGDRLSPEHEITILERLLPFHPECKKKIGCGVDYLTMGYHPDFESSRCLFIVRKDGQMVDFSYWKCIKGFIRKNYPLYAESFILRHFRRRRHIG